MIGMICCKKRELKSDPYTYGELYIDDIIVTVKKDVYLNHHIGDVVEYDYTNHVSFSGVAFHNLTEIRKISTSILSKSLNREVNKSSFTKDEMAFYLKNSSRFFMLIKVAFLSLVLFFIEMYFVARFELDIQFQASTGKSYFLLAMFLFLFAINFIFLRTILILKFTADVRKLMTFQYEALVVEFVQDNEYCTFYYIDSNGKNDVLISMEQFHQVKNAPILKLSFLNDSLFYSLSN